MINSSDLSDRELATCVDEYVKRVFDRFHSNDEFRNEYIFLSVTAHAGSADTQYKIVHKVNICYGTSQTVESNNALESVQVAMMRVLADRCTPPTEVVRALPAPEPVVEEPCRNLVEDAEFSEIDEDRPF